MSDWRNMDLWYTVLPPSRPTVAELRRIEEYIVGISRQEPVAILGCTPEFRDLLSQMGFEQRYIFDISVDFYQRMTTLLPVNVKSGEHLVVGEWIDSLRKFESYFSVVLSDLTMGNISYDKQRDFYSAISGSIRDGGVFIDKVLAFDFPVPTLSDLFAKYEKLPINLRTINDFSSEVLFCSELVTEQNVVDSSKFYEIIREGAYSEKIKFFADAAHMITPEGFTWSYGKKWDELKDAYGEFYSSQKVFAEEDPGSPYYHRTKQFFNIK